MKVVLDTNIWLSGLFWEGEANKLIKLAEKGKINVIISRGIINEILDVLNKETKFSKFLADKKRMIEDLIRTILSITELIETTSKLSIIKSHPADNIILEAALDGKANYIISYNKHILDLVEFRDIRILHPGDFLRLVSRNN